jgi:circadian clock protein KaiC
MALHHVDRAPTGVTGLDNILHGGLIPGRLYLVDGNPGAGKTTLALQYLLEGVRAGEKCLYVTLSETKEELAAGAQSHGWSLEGIDVLELVADKDELGGEADLTMYFPSEIELTDTTRKVLEAVERTRPQRMVLDSLSELRLLAQSSLRYRRQILALKQFFVGRGCTVLLLDDRTAEGPDLQLQSIAHGVISLGHKAPAYGRTLRQVQVIKFRGGDFRSGYHDFVIREGGAGGFPPPDRRRAWQRLQPHAHPKWHRRLGRFAGRWRGSGHQHLAGWPAGQRQIHRLRAVRRGRGGPWRPRSDLCI